MGNRGDVYERYYLPNFVDKDCLAIFLGTTRRDDLVRAVGRLERHSGAPDELNDVQKDEIRNHPELIELARCRKRYAAKIRQCGYPTIKAAKGTKWFERHDEAQRIANSLRTKLTREKLDKIIDNFHETVHTEEVDRQMRGIFPSPVDLNPSTIEYELEERATVARLLFQPLDDLKLDEMFRVRIQLVQALAGLCGRQETPHQFKKSTKTPRPADTADILIDIDYPTHSPPQLPVDAAGHAVADPNHGIDGLHDHPVTPDLFCPFCKWGDEEVGPRKRNHLYARPDSLGRHIRDQHLADRDANDGFDCPYEGCSAFLGGAEHFLNHTECQHGLTLWCAKKR
jgi:Protein of unknown function (DUF3435)